MTSHEHEPRQDKPDLERLRPRLTALAYRMLGTTADAEDAVQDAFLRYQRHEGEIDSAEAWLVRVTTRVCIDRSRRGGRETYVGHWLPEPVPEGAAWAEDRAELAESLSTAFMVLLETLNPVERAAFLLRDVFGYEFERVAEVIGKSPANARQIAVRARRRLGLGESRFAASQERSTALAKTFFDACRSGDLDRIEAMLAADATLVSDGGGHAFAAARPLTQRGQIAKLLSVAFRKGGRSGRLKFVQVGGQPAAAIYFEERPASVVTLGVRAGSVGAIYVMRNPEKLRLWAANVADRDRPPPGPADPD